MNLFKTLITSAYSKSSNSAGLNPVLLKFHEKICEIIVSKTWYGVFLIFCCSCFVNNFIVKNKFSKRNITKSSNILRSIYFLKISSHHFENFIYTKSAGGIFLSKRFFQVLGAFSTNANPLILASLFRTKKIIFHFFPSVLI